MEEPILDHSDVWAFSKAKQEWVVCKVVADDIDEGVVTILDDEKKEPFVIKKSEICVVDPTHHQDLSDLSLMNNLHEAPLINVLRTRWLGNRIYTAASDVLISVNPYKTIPGLYSSPSTYFNFPRSANALDDDEYYESIVDLNPHVYLIANRSLRSLVSPSLTRNAPTNQSVIISGESGAGKTEASKHVVNFLIHANQLFIKSSQNTTPKSYVSANSSFVLDRVGIKDLILESSVIFEAFGNAKTVRNDNSSRFGKYIKLQYSPTFELISAATETFLLEKSRLVNVGENERNYHIFYQMLRGLKGLNANLYTELYLYDIKHFKILTMGNCTHANDSVNDAEEFKSLYQALYSLDTSDELLKGLWMILSCILHLGNAIVHEPSEMNDFCTIEIPTAPIDILASMLGVEANALTKSLVSATFRSGQRSSIHVKTLSAMDSLNNINAVMKWLYFQVFMWLVNTINHAHSRLNVYSEDYDDDMNGLKFIGILDIFGFEILTINSFEQLCINYTNERLQQQFNEYVFLSEQDLYSREGLDWTTISYKDNQNIIDLIAKKPIGMLLVLEEHGMMNRAPDDSALLHSLNQHHEKNEAYIKSKFKGEGFSIKHFAGIVTYSIQGFLNKNNNSLQEDLNELLAFSTNQMLRQVLDGTFGSNNNMIHTHSIAGIDTGVGIDKLQAIKRELSFKSSRKMSSSVTVSLQFRGQLDTLIKTLRETHPHYIKCIKPNDYKNPKEFNWPIVAAQLRYSGVLEVVRIRREGYPIRLPFIEFYKKYYLTTTQIFQRLYPNWRKSESELDCSNPLNEDIKERIEEIKECCNLMLKPCITTGNYQIGHTLIFLRENGFIDMQKGIKRMYANYAIKLQSWSRGYRTRKEYIEKRNDIIKIQQIVRGYIYRMKYKRCHHSIQVLQRKYRYKIWSRKMMIAYKKFRVEFEEKLKRIRAQILISCNYRMSKQYRYYRKLYLATIDVQTYMRGYMARRRAYIQRNAGSIVQLGISKRYRCKIIRKQYMMIRQNIILLQSLARRFLAKQILRHLQEEYRLKCATRIQLYLSSHYRKRKAMIWYEITYYYILLGQSLIRRYLSIQKVKRVREERRIKAGTCIQLFLSSQYKQLITRHAYLRIRSHIILIQSLIRRYHSMKRLSILRQEKLDKAGTTIQLILSSKYRSYRSQQIYKQSIKRIILLQSIQRKHRAKRIAMALRLKRQTAAGLVIQIFLSSHYRKICVRRLYLIIYKKIVLLQSLIRRYIAIKIVDKLRIRKHASIVIQSRYRRYIANKIYQQTVKHIITIQSFLRQVKCQKRYYKLLTSSIKVQKVYRGYNIRSKVIYKMIWLIITLQKNIRRKVYHEQYKKKLLAIQYIQRIGRGYISRKRSDRIKYQLVLIQSFIRMAQCYKKYQTILFHIILLQSYIRKVLSILSYKKQKQKIVLIQSLIRRYLYRKRYKYSIAMIVKIQSYARVWNSIRWYQMILYHIITIQTHIRKIIKRKYYRINYKRIISIQSLIRRYITRIKYQQMRKGFVLFQSIGRMYIQRKIYERIQYYAIQIQSLVRKHIAVKHYRTQTFACIRIQTFIRCSYVKHYYRYMRKCAIIIAKYMRRYMAKQYLAYLKVLYRNAVTIQKYFRAVVRKLRLYYFIQNLHRIMRDGSSSNSNGSSSSNNNSSSSSSSNSNNILQYKLIRSNPMILKEFRYVRNKWMYYESIIHAACQSDTSNNLKLLNPTIYDMLDVDILGNTALHISMRRMVDMEVIYELFDILDKYKYTPPVIVSNNEETIVFAEEGDSDEEDREDEEKTSSSSPRAGSSDNTNNNSTTTTTSININSTKSALSPTAVGSPTTSSKRPSMIMANIAEFVSSNTSSGVGSNNNNNNSSSSSSSSKDVNNSQVTTTSNGYDLSNESNSSNPNQNVTIIRQGFLKKKSEGLGFWQKRYFILTDNTLQYYGSSSKIKNINKPRMKILLDGCQISRYVNPNGKISQQPIIEITLPNFTEKRNFFGKVIQRKTLLFQATDEKDLQEWLYPMKAVAGFVSFRETAVKYVLLDLHELYVSERNYNGETPLHMLLKSYQRFNLHILQSKQSKDSKISMAIKKRVLILASWLIDKGCNIEIRDRDGYNIIDLCRLHQFKELLHYLEGIKIYLSIRNNIIHLRGYSYLNIFYGSMQMNLNSASVNMINYSSCLQPRLRISIYNQKRQIIEDPIDIGLPAIQESSYFWWGTSWYMQTPLENIQPDSIVITEFYEQPGILAAWNRFDFNTETVDSDLLEMPMRKAPMLWDNSGSTNAKHSHVIGMLQCRVMISRKIKAYTIDDVRKQELRIVVPVNSVISTTTESDQSKIDLKSIQSSSEKYKSYRGTLSQLDLMMEEVTKELTSSTPISSIPPPPSTQSISSITQYTNNNNNNNNTDIVNMESLHKAMATKGSSHPSLHTRPSVVSDVKMVKDSSTILPTPLPISSKPSVVLGRESSLSKITTNAASTNASTATGKGGGPVVKRYV